MNGVEAWMLFAEEDMRAARVLLRESMFPQACFHGQQAGEKALKAFLKSRKRKFPKTHSLTDLLVLASAIDPGFRALEAPCLALSQFYVPTRYPDAAAGSLPGGLPNKADAEKALADAEAILSFVRSQIRPAAG